jgi:flagellar biosynthetic protein FlhB
VNEDDEGSGEKTHEATPQRLEKARQEGDLPRSQDAQTFAAYLGFGAAMLLAGDWAAERMGEVLLPFLDRPGELATQFVSAGASDATLTLLGQIAPLFLPLVGGPVVMILALLLHSAASSSRHRASSRSCRGFLRSTTRKTSTAPAVWSSSPKARSS